MENFENRRNENNEDEKNRTDIKGLIAGLYEYNDRFSVGRVLSRHIRGQMEGRDSEWVETTTPETANEAEQQAQRLKELREKFQETLYAIGLSLEPVNAPFMMFGTSGMTDDEVKRRIEQFSEETGITAEDLNDPDSYEARKAGSFWEELQAEANAPNKLTKIQLNVSDAKKFLSYLDSFQETGMSLGEKESLKKIAEIIEKQFIDQYDVDDPNDDRFLAIIGSLEGIIKRYENIGLSESVEKLKELLEVTRNKYLKEHLMVERVGYLVPHGEGFGPAEWHEDMNPELYESSWQKAVRIYDQVASNPNAKELAEKLHDHLLEAINIAKKEIESNVETDDGHKNDRLEFLETLEKVRALLAHDGLCCTNSTTESLYPHENTALGRCFRYNGCI